MTKCPDCGGEFEEGCILDHTYGAVAIQRYARSDMPDVGNKLVMGINEGKYYDVRKVVTYRCKKCNRLFPYALDTVLVTDVSARSNKMIWVVIIFFVVAVYIGIVLSASGI